jgi:hypothetical protein
MADGEVSGPKGAALWSCVMGRGLCVAARAHAALNRFGVLDVLGPDCLFHSVDEAVNRLARLQ